MLDKLPSQSQSVKESRPDPDPTTLTTAQLLREIDSLKELVFTRLDGMDTAIKLFNENITRVPTDTDKKIQHLKELHEAAFEAANDHVAGTRGIIETRFDGMDKAIELLQDTSNKFPARIDEKIDSLRDVHKVRFESIEGQFKERDVRSEQTQRDSKTGLDTALTAAKDAVGEQNRSFALATAKSEAATMKQIDQITNLIQTGSKAVDDKFDDIKERLTRIEGGSEGGQRQQVQHVQERTQANWGVTVSISAIAVLVSLCAFLFMILRK